MSGKDDEFDSVEDISEEASDAGDESSKDESEEASKEEKKSDKKTFRDDPFASLNMPPPVGMDDSEEESDDSEEEKRRGPAISALDANSASKKKPQGSQLSKKSESFLASLGVGMDSEEESSEDVPKKQLRPVQTPALNNANIFGGFENNEIASLNDPFTTHLEDAPLIGGRISSSTGVQGVMGRSTSPKLFTQGSQFPTCTQLKCFKWENGVPVSIGAIDAQADESDFIREFFEDMPQKGDGKVRYSFRPIDMNGQELGSEVAFFISETHKDIRKRKRAMEEDSESEEESGGGFASLFNRSRKGGNSSIPSFRRREESSFASDADRVWGRMVQDTREQTETLRSSLESERERLRRLEEERSQERVDLAVNTAQGVQALSNQMLEAEQHRAQLALQQQQQQTDVMMNSLSQIFSQQQSMTTLQMQRQQQADEMRVEQERQRAERERLDLEERRRRDREDYEERRNREQREMELKWKEMEEQRRWEREQLRLQLEKEKQEYEQRRIEEQRKWEREMELNRMRMEQERLDQERRIAREREELLLKLKMDREDIERKEQARKEEREAQEQRRKEEMELRQKQMDIQAQRDKEHQERLLQMAIAEREVQREALERKAQLEKDARDAEERERTRRHEMMMKELEQTRQRDREHSERMFLLQQKEIDLKGTNSLDSLLPKAAGFLSQFGLEPVDVLRSVLGQGEVGDDEDYGESESKGSSWLENLPRILGSVGDIAKLVTSGMGGQVALPQSQPMPMLTQDPNLQNLMYQQQMVQEQMMRQQAAQPKPQPNFDQFYPPPPQQQRQNPYSGNQQVVNKSAEEDYTLNIPEEVLPKVPTTTDLAISAGMEMKDQRNARKGLRTLVKKLASSKKDSWEDHVTSALMSEISIFSYIVAVTAKTAILEAGADPDLCSQIISALKASEKLKETLAAFGMTIDNIPFGE